MFECALGMAARAVPDAGWRGEVVDVARRSAAEQGRVGRAREVAATAAFGLRLRSLRATGGRAGEVWRQGAALGAGLLLTTAWVGSLAAPADGPAAAAIAVALVATLAGRRVVAGLATAAAVIASALSVGWDPVTSALVVALAATVARGTGTRGRGAVPGAWWWGLGLGVLGLAALTGAGDTVAQGTALVATLVVPIGLVALGAADGRAAAAAAVVWGWRFLALDPADVADAGAALVRGDGLRVVLVRLVVMAWAVGLAVALALRTERRAAL